MRHPLTDTGERTGRLRTVLPLLHCPGGIQNGRGGRRGPPQIPGTSRKCVVIPMSRSSAHFRTDPFLEYGQTDAYVAPRQDNLNSRMISTSIPRWVRRNLNPDKSFNQPCAYTAYPVHSQRVPRSPNTQRHRPSSKPYPL